MATRSRYRWLVARPRVVRTALLALLLHLALPFLGLGQLAARGAGDAPFVICTGAGLVWVNPDGTPVEEQGEPDQSCPICAPSQLAATALLPAAPALTLPAPQATQPASPMRHVTSARRVAPPLPARGPPPAT